MKKAPTMGKSDPFLSAIGALGIAVLANACAGAPSLPSHSPNAAPGVPSIALPSFARRIEDALPQPGVPSDEYHNAFSNGMFIYTAQLYGDDAKIYRRKGDTITFLEKLRMGLSAPQGTVAAPDGAWYVANAGHSNVLVYRSTSDGPKGPIATLDDYGQFPGNVDVTPDRRLVAVSNISTTSDHSGSVSVYLNRKSEPSRMLAYGNDVSGVGIAIDHQHNCYWSFNDAETSKGSIVEFAGCKGAGKVIVPAIGFAGGLAFDQNDDLFYVDQTTGIYKCDGTQSCTLFATGFGVPLNINFDHRQKHLWVSDLTGFIDAVNPATGVIESRTRARDGTGDPPFGVAPEPGN